MMGIMKRRLACLAAAAGTVGAVTVLADDAEDSRKAFVAVYEVLMHPRCLNCHPSGDQPLQGEDSHIHMQNIQRGEDGKGVFAQRCDSCHQATNLPGKNMPPGNPNWHLPEKKMPLVFQGKAPAELAAQLKDPARNGGKTMQQMVDHVTRDELVLWGWSPGEGRPPPPLEHAEFARRFKEWVDKGAEIPDPSLPAKGPP